MVMSQTFRDRLVAKSFMDTEGPQINGKHCWISTRAHKGRDYNPKTGEVTGYPQITIGSKTVVAFKLAYWLFVGPIPEGMVLDHVCKNKRCIQPAHLEPVSRTENNRRAHERPRQARPRIGKALARKIRHEYAEGGTSHMKLAKKYKISRPAITDILTNRTYQE